MELKWKSMCEAGTPLPPPPPPFSTIEKNYEKQSTPEVQIFYALLSIGKQEICGNCIKAGFFNVIIQDIAVHGTND